MGNAGSLPGSPIFSTNFFRLILRRPTCGCGISGCAVLCGKEPTWYCPARDAAGHLRHFYNIPPRLQVHVLPFVSMIDMEFVHLPGIREKYEVPEKYFHRIEPVL